MLVTSVSAKGLFGVFDHHIPLSREEPVTIIHGPNGFGKTAILKLIAAAGESSLGPFETTPFDEFRLTFADDSAWIVRRTTDAANEDGEHRAQLQFLQQPRPDQPPRPLPATPADVPLSVLERIDRHVPTLALVKGRRAWIDSAGRQYPLSEIISRYPRVRSLIPTKYRQTSFPRSLNVFFVQTNRLQAETEPEPEEAPDFYLPEGFPGYLSPDRKPRKTLRVEQYSTDVVTRIKSLLAEYAKHSQESDRTFPERLVKFVRDQKLRHEVLPAVEILKRMEQLEKKRERLISLGFIDRESGLQGLRVPDVEAAKEALTIYVGDVDEKLQVFDQLAERIGRLMDLINARFKYKSLRIDRETGFCFESDAGGGLSLDSLSSGEQHELVFLYELLFRVPAGGLVLVDEPEISLHVSWQAQFLPDLIEILDVTKAYAIVATHSPVVIGGRRDLAVVLSGPERTRKNG